MELPGPWVAAEANDDIRRNGIGLDPIGPEWSEIDVPGQWQHHPKFAASNGPVLYRTNFHAPAPAEGRRRWVTFDGIFYQGDVWLDGAYLGDPEGYFIPHSFDITDLSRFDDEHVLAIEVTCSPQRDIRNRRNITGVLQQSEWFDRSFNPGGLWRPVRLYDTGPGAHRSPACALPGRRPPPRPPAHRRSARQRRAATDRDPHADRRRPARRDHPHGGERRQRPRVEPRPGRPGVVVAAFARRPAADDGHRRSARRRRVERPPSTAHRAPSGDAGTTGSVRSTASGSSSRAPTCCRRAATSPASSPPRPATTSSRRSISASTPCACTGTSPIATPTTPPTNWASCSCRTSRCSGGTPDRSAPRRSTRRAPSSTRSGTIRRS